MTSTRLRQTLTAATAAGLTAAAVVMPGLADAGEPAGSTLASVTLPAGPATPHPPLLPANFQGKGRYIVRDLGVDVPFTWQAATATVR